MNLMVRGGLVKIKYEFINLKINGKNEGLYVFEEVLEKYF